MVSMQAERDITFLIFSFLSCFVLAVILPYIYSSNCGILISSIGVDMNVAMMIYDIKNAPLLGRKIQL